jgi:hypothetical protein
MVDSKGKVGRTAGPWQITPTLGKLAITRPHKKIGIDFDTICRMESNRDGSIDAEANAEFIVRAANCHDELVAAVKLVLTDWPSNRDGMDYEGPLPVGVKALRAALKKATEGEGR